MILIGLESIVAKKYKERIQDALFQNRDKSAPHIYASQRRLCLCKQALNNVDKI